MSDEIKLSPELVQLHRRAVLAELQAGELIRELEHERREHAIARLRARDLEQRLGDAQARILELDQRIHRRGNRGGAA